MWEKVVESGRRAPDAPAFTALKGKIAQMFLGQFQHNLDDKGRLMIPARFRELLEGGAFITQGFDKCLMVMTEAYFKQVYDRINAMNLADPTARLLRRLILSNAYPVEVDKVGRILMPQNLRTFLGIENGERSWPGRANTSKCGRLPCGTSKWLNCRISKPTTNASPRLIFQKY